LIYSERNNWSNNLPDDNQPFARNHGGEGISSIHHVEHWKRKARRVIKSVTNGLTGREKGFYLFATKSSQREMKLKQDLPSLASMVCNQLPPSTLDGVGQKRNSSLTSVR
jgi:hypothetical protein